MTITHDDRLTVKAGDLLPGFHYRPTPGSELYFPEIGWAEYIGVFIAIRDSCVVECCNLHYLWRKMTEQRFGHVLTGDEPQKHGKAWTWEIQENRLRVMLDSFEKHGYKPSLANRGEDIEVTIQADGTMPVLQGNKRVALCRMFYGQEYELAVKVKKRAPEWIERKKDIWNIAGGKMDCYQPIEHPDFAGWTVTQPCIERVDMMTEEFAGEWPKTVLDLGCHTGWFCRGFAAAGSEVTGVEKKASAHRMARLLTLYRQTDPVTWPIYHNLSISEFFECGPVMESYDVCLYLSVIMHVFRDYGIAGGWAELKRISGHCKRMFMDLSWGAYAKHLPFTPDNIGPMICEKTAFTSWQLLGRTDKENRPFYVFRI